MQWYKIFGKIVSDRIKQQKKAEKCGRRVANHVYRMSDPIISHYA